MNYEQTLEYLFAQLPMFQRVGGSAYKANLENTIALDNYLGNPHKKYKTIHIAGTNGKGSTAHTIASILQTAGYKTGLYTSPHYLDFRERIKIDGKMISKEFVVDFTEKHSNFFIKLKPSFFEITVAMAFDYFAQNKVDVAVIEVGMGGRLDSTNIITPLVSVITGINFDHTQFLGSTLTEIAGEKAGIIKKNIPVVVGKINPELKTVFSKKAQELDAPLFYVEHNYEVNNYTFTPDFEIVLNIEKHGKPDFYSLETPLGGEYQKFNIPTVLQTIEILQKKFNINKENIYEGVYNVKVNTGIVGRWHLLNKSPKILCDAAHNLDGITNVINQLKQLKFDKLHFVFGVVNDKDVSNILKKLPSEAIYYFTKAKIPRALDQNELKSLAMNFGLYGDCFSNVAEAIKVASNNAKTNDLVFVSGSSFVVADAIEYFENIKNS